jgi:hypothetical protein
MSVFTCRTPTSKKGAVPHERLELKPELTPAAAVMVAIEAFDESFNVDPAEAADLRQRIGHQATYDASRACPRRHGLSASRSIF